MRTVVPSHEVYHLWANEAQPRARNARDTVSFDGASAYSYAAEIGRIVRNAAGERAFLLSTHSYSITTSKHQSFLRGAVPRGALVFHLPRLELVPVEVLAEYAVQLADLTGKAKRARTRRGMYLSDIANVKAEADRYCRFFGLADAFEATAVTALIAEHQQVIADARAVQQVEYERMERERMVEMEAMKEAWLAGEDADLYHYPTILLRLTNPSWGNREVETSRGAVVPLYAVRRALALYAADRDLTGRRIGPYHITEATEERIVIGCHIILRAELDRFAHVLEAVA